MKWVFEFVRHAFAALRPDYPLKLPTEVVAYFSGKIRKYGIPPTATDVCKEGNLMFRKLIIATSSAALFSTSVMAGSLVAPEMEPQMEVMEEEAASSSGGLLLPLLALVAIGLLIANDDDETPPQSPSDMRVKRDIVRIGTAANGLPVYNFKYLWSDQTYQGVMAQDVLSHTPDAVVVNPHGLLSVNYDMLGLEMSAVD